MSEIIFGANADLTIQETTALPDASVLGTCSCGGTQFRVFKKAGDTFLTCPTCGTPFKQ